MKDIKWILTFLLLIILAQEVMATSELPNECSCDSSKKLYLNFKTNLKPKKLTVFIDGALVIDTILIHKSILNYHEDKNRFSYYHFETKIFSEKIVLKIGNRTINFNKQKYCNLSFHIRRFWWLKFDKENKHPLFS